MSPLLASILVSLTILPLACPLSWFKFNRHTYLSLRLEYAKFALHFELSDERASESSLSSSELDATRWKSVSGLEDVDGLSFYFIDFLMFASPCFSYHITPTTLPNLAVGRPYPHSPTNT